MHNLFLLSQSLSDLFTAANLPLLLLFGSGILAVSLLLLALTHWGHSRPIWKCVVLSVAAHILLMGYAYGTRYLWNSNVEIKQTADADFDELQVTLVDDVGDADSTQLETDRIQPSDLPTTAFDMPAVAPLMRPEIDSELVVETPRPTFTPTTTPTFESNMKLPAESSFDPELQMSEQQQFELLPEAKILDPEPIELNRRRQENAFDSPPLSFDGELARQTPEVSDVNTNEPSVRPEESAELPMPPQVASRSLPRPEMAPALTEIADAQPIPRPERFASNLDIPNSLRMLERTRRIGDGQPIPKIYSLRNPASRMRVARQRGGSTETETAVDAALNWLAVNQQADGSWDPKQTGAGREDRIFGHNRDGAGARAESGITGLATLAFLGAGHSHLEGDHQEVVEKALAFLISQQRKDGDLSGNAKLFAKMYCHSMSLLAISEALAMTGDRNLVAAVERGVGFSEFAQNRKDGGWRYQPGDSGDMSQFGWQVLALKSASLGGVKVSSETTNRMRDFLKSCSSGIGGGLASYRPNQGPTTTMTAEALLCRFFLEPKVAPMTLMTAQRQIVSELPNPNHVNLYYWYYGTMAMYHAGGKDWERWNRELKSTLLPMQIKEGNDRGSYPANGMWGGYGGTVYSTAMATLNLEVYYRYLPLYQQMTDATASETMPTLRQ